MGQWSDFNQVFLKPTSCFPLASCFTWSLHLSENYHMQHPMLYQHQCEELGFGGDS